jgi:hypothetical protein
MDWTGPLTSYLHLNVKEGADVGGLLATLGSAVQSAIEREIGRTFDNVAYCEVYDGGGRPVLFLNHDPIVSLASVSDTGSVLTVQPSAMFDPAAPPTWPLPRCVVNGGQALRLTDGSVFSSGTQNIIVVYTAGLTGDGSGPPAELVQAGVYWAGLLFRERNRLGVSSETIAGQITSFSNVIPPDVDRMISGWRRAILPCSN